MRNRSTLGLAGGIGLLAIVLACTPATTRTDDDASMSTGGGAASSTSETAAADDGATDATDATSAAGAAGTQEDGRTTAGKSYKDLEFPPLSEPTLPKVHEEVLSNGMTLFLLEDHELPLVSASAMIRAGSVFEPAEKVGLAGMVGQVMRSGGTETTPGDKLDEMLEEIAASVETGVGSTSGSASLSCLKENFGEVLPVFADVLMNPAFPEEKIELAKVQARSAIARRNDQAGDITSREFAKLLYGADSPYGRTPEYATVDAIGRDDLVAFHGTFFHPDRVLLAVWGDIDPAKTKEAVEKAFAGWEKSDGSAPSEIPQPAATDAPKVNFIRKADINQTNIRMGHMGVRRDHPDYYSIEVLNDIFGGGFSSRLFAEVRSKRGLAYSVGSRFSAPFDRPGAFAMICQTKSETTHAAISSMIAEAERIRTEEVTDEELAKAKDSILNSFVFNFDSPGEIIGRRLVYEYYGYPEDLLEQYRKGIAAVTKASILEAAKKHIRPDEFLLLAVGREEDFDKPLETFGEVNVIDIESSLEQSVGGARPAATAESREQGLALLAEAAAAHGGAEKFKNLTAYTMEAVVKSQERGSQGELIPRDSKMYVRFPDKSRLERDGQMGPEAMIVDGNQGWVQMGGTAMAIPPAFAKEVRESAYRNIFTIFREYDSEGAEVQLLPEAAEGQAAVLVTTPAGLSLQARVDAETKRIVGISYFALNPMSGPEERDEVYDDFREVGGLQLPFYRKTTEKASGKLLAEIELKTVELDPELEDDLFADPTGR